MVSISKTQKGRIAVGITPMMPRSAYVVTYSKKLQKNEPIQAAREQRAGCDLIRMRLLRSAFSVIQKGSLHARPRVSHR
jgi:hypothetical protein